MNSKTKGNSFERKLCVLLSRWWTNGSRPDVFWRTASSGGRATQRAKAGDDTRNQYGDVGITDPIGQPFLDFCTIELKRGYSSFSVADLLDRPARSKVPKYGEWVTKVRDSWVRAGSLYWLLVVQRDRRDALAFFPLSMWDDLRRCSCFLPPHPPGEFYLYNDPPFGCERLSGLLDTVSPGDVFKVLRSKRTQAG